jgi:hypothetical protein
MRVETATPENAKKWYDTNHRKGDARDLDNETEENASKAKHPFVRNDAAEQRKKEESIINTTSETSRRSRRPPLQIQPTPCTKILDGIKKR